MGPQPRDPAPPSPRAPLRRATLLPQRAQLDLLQGGAQAAVREFSQFMTAGKILFIIYIGTRAEKGLLAVPPPCPGEAPHLAGGEGIPRRHIKIRTRVNIHEFP